MQDPEIDHAAVFRALPGMVALLTPELVYIDANEDFERLSGRTREELIGRYIFDVFPENPGDPAAAGMRETRESMLRAATTGERDTMALRSATTSRTPCVPADGWSTTGARSTHPCSAPTER